MGRVKSEARAQLPLTKEPVQFRGDNLVRHWTVVRVIGKEGPAARSVNCITDIEKRSAVPGRILLQP